MLADLTQSEETSSLGDEAVGGALRLIRGRVALNAREAVQADIEIEDGHIRSVVEFPSGREVGTTSHRLADNSETVDLTGCLILPGLVNAHDHLEFNLFPRLGHGPYTSVTEWANDIYQPDRSPIREHIAAPKPVRLGWGALKNLLCGVTTVCHHNPYEEVFDSGFPVRVVKRFGWTHSLSFGTGVAQAFRKTPTGLPFILHLGEGTDARSQEEIFLLDRMGALDSRTVIVHGVGLDSAGHELVHKRGAALVWCPTSNFFTLGKTLEARAVGRHQRIALGSDSALTAQGDLLDELRAAHEHFQVSSELLYAMVTTGAADVLRLGEGEGSLRKWATADLTVLKWRGDSPADSLVQASFKEIHAVIVGGRLALASPQLAERWPKSALNGLACLLVEGTERWVRAPVEGLIKVSKAYLGESIRLAGKQVSA